MLLSLRKRALNWAERRAPSRFRCVISVVLVCAVVFTGSLAGEFALVVGADASSTAFLDELAAEAVLVDRLSISVDGSALSESPSRERKR